MTPDILQAMLSTLKGPPDALSDGERTALLRTLERLADGAPGDRELSAVLWAAHGYATADAGLPPIVADVRRSTLLRWDAWSVTFGGEHTHTGASTMVRVLRHHAQSDPVARRALAREGALLAKHLPHLGVQHSGGPRPALFAPMPGVPLDQCHHETPGGDATWLARMLGTGIESLRRWEVVGIELPALSANELRDGGHGVQVVCLSPGSVDHARGNMSTLAHAVARWWGQATDSPVGALLAGFQTFAPGSAEEARQRLMAALREDLSGRRHRLAIRRARGAHTGRRARLMQLIGRLGTASPAPQGRGAIGVDLNGEITVLTGQSGRLVWGASPDSLQDVLHPRTGLNAKAARRLLRSRAQAPPNQHLDARVQGDPAFTDAACRWVAATLALRTARLLLEVPE